MKCVLQKDMSTFNNVKKRLNGCRPFAWYLKRFKVVYEDAGLIPPEIFMIREDGSPCAKRHSHSRAPLLGAKRALPAVHGRGRNERLRIRGCEAAVLRPRSRAGCSASTLFGGGLKTAIRITTASSGTWGIATSLSVAFDTIQRVVLEFEASV